MALASRLFKLTPEECLAGATREAAGPQAQSIDSRVRSSISQLVSAQRSDGGWSWTGRGGASNRYSTARVVWAVSLARKSGYVVPDAAWNARVRTLPATSGS